jgi:GTP-binding protein
VLVDPNIVGVKNKLPYHHAKFIQSAAKLSQLPPDQGVEVAFAGRSNAGKSSALNLITRHHNLARTSKTPGRTQLINVFELNAHHRLVDLPGYGYAKVPPEIRQRWQATLGQYLANRMSLYGLILIMDIRHPLKELDLVMIDWAQLSQLAVHVLLTKADKLSRSQVIQTVNEVKKALEDYPAPISVQAFSTLQKLGLPEVYAVLDNWFNIAPTNEQSNE